MDSQYATASLCITRGSHHNPATKLSMPSRAPARRSPHTCKQHTGLHVLHASNKFLQLPPLRRHVPVVAGCSGSLCSICSIHCHKPSVACNYGRECSSCARPLPLQP